MNALCYRTVFSKRHGTLVAVGEHANSQGKANGAHGVASPGAEPFGLTHIMSRFLGVLTASFILVTFALAQPAPNALPKSGRVSQGAVQFSQSAQQLQITQSSDRAAVNWQSFDIGAAAKVNVVQPSAQSVLLNRVEGTAPSQIFGQLQANGKVILVNPNGMVFGQDGSVSAAAFTASTLNISDADFMAGNERYTRDGATGAIVNRGLIQAAPGGYVALLGASVSNEGQIVAPQGNVYMAAADAVSLPASAVAMPMGSSGRIRLELTPASINVAVANQKGGTIVTGGGQVYLQAAALNQAMASVLQSGSIDTTGEQGGAVHVLADGGTIKVDGRITANSTKAAAGGDIIIGRDEETGVLAHATDVSGAILISNKGFVETSGDWLATYGTIVKAKDWLLDPYNINIVGTASGTAYSDPNATGGSYLYTPGVASNIRNIDIQNSLNDGTNVKITTGLLGTNGSDEGNITVNAEIIKSGSNDATLTLEAYNGITVNQRIGKAIGDSASNGKLNVTITANGGVAGATSKGITLNKVIDANGGVVTLTGTNKNAAGGNANSGVVFNGGSGITAGNFVVKGYQSGAASISNIDKNGIYFNGASALKSTDASSLEGASNSQGNLGAGIYAESGANLTVDSGTTGTMRFAGSNSNVGYRGVRFGGTSNAAINVKGNVLFEGTDANTAANNGVFLRANVTQQSNSTLTLKGSSVEIYNGTTVAKTSVATNTTLNLGDVTLTYANGFVNVGSAGLASLAADNINIVGSTSAAGQQGVLIQSGSTLTANTIYVKGSALGTAGGSATAKGIHLSNGILNATNNITLDGTSTNVTGVALEAGSVTSSGGDVVIKATTTAGQYQGANIAVPVSGKSVAITGNSTNHIGVNIGAAVTSTGGGVTIEGTSLNSTGVYVNNSVTSTAGDINITGISNKGDGVYVGNSPTLSKITSNDGAINITGTSDQQRGVWLDGNAVVQSKKSLSTPLTSVGVTIKGKSNGIVAFNNVGAQIQGSVKAAGKLSITGDTLGLGLYQGVNIAKAVSGDTVEITGTSAKHNGVEITGSVTSTSATQGTVYGTGTNAFISGDIKIEGTSALGQGVAMTSNSATPAISAANNVIIKGTSKSAGVVLVGTTTVTGKNVTIEGTSANGNGVFTNVNIKATSDDISITGKSVGAFALSLQGVMTASQNVKIKGENTSSGNSTTAVYINKVVTATAGTIDITAITAGTSSLAMQIDSGASLITTNNAINLNADTLSLASVATINAGTGTVSIKTVSAGAKMNIGGADAGSATTSAPTLGLSNAELNQITAGNLIIGDASNTGGITVSAATTTAAQTGNVTLQTGGNMTVNAALTIDSSKTLTLNGAGANSIIKDGTSGAIKTSQLELLGANAAVTLDSKLHEVGTLAADVKSLNFENKTALIVGAVNTINSAPGGTVGIQAKDGVSVTTQTGNLNINEAISNSTSGNVVVGAGVAGLAGELSSASSGDVQTLNGKTITTQSGGKTLVYTGSAAGSGLLSHLSTNFSDLKVTGVATGTNAQNTDTNFAFNNGAGISVGSTASEATAQVMFREKVTITNGLVGTTLTKTYGDASTAFGSDAALFADAKAALKTANAGSYTIGTGTNNIVIDKAAVIDSMTGNLSGPTYNSTNTYLKATTHNYGALSSFKYTTQNIVAGNVKVTVAQRALTGLIAQGNTTYGDTLVAGAVNLTNKVGTDVVSAVSTDVSFNIAGKTSGSGKLKAGTHTDVQLLSSLTGADKDNYTFANVKGSYKVDQKALTGSIAQGNTTYGDTLVAGAVNLTNKVGTDVVSAVSTDVIFNIAGKTSGSGKLKAGTHTDVQSLTSLTGADKDNYTFADVKGNYTVNQRALTGSISDVTTVYGTSAAVGFASVNRLDGDDVFANQTVVLTGQAFSTSNNLKAGTYTQSVGSGVGGVDAGNYTFAGTSSSNYVVNRLNLATQIADVSTNYGTAAATGAASITGQIIGDEVSLSGVASLVNSAFSSSNRLRVGAYQQTVGAALGGTDAGNYTAAPTTLANYVVTPKVILASVTAADKVYDGSAAAALLATSVDILAGDTVSVTGLTGNFASKNVLRDGAGSVVAQAVTVAGGVAGLGGADGANYVLGNAASVPATTARITPRELIVSGITAADKVYDGNTAAVVSVANAALANVVIGDNVGVGTQNAQGNFADKNVARGADGQVLAKAVLVSGLQLQGTDAGNYSLSNNASASAQARITPRTVSLSGNTAQDKVVDGSATAQVRAGSLSGLVSGESLNVNAQGEFEDALVGNSKLINARFSLVNGSNGLAFNYDLANTTAALRASILAFLPASVDPASGLPTGARPTASRTRFSGASGAGAATGVNDEPINTELTEQCSVLNPELCECEDTKLPGVEMCYAPSKVASLKD